MCEVLLFIVLVRHMKASSRVQGSVLSGGSCYASPGM